MKGLFMKFNIKDKFTNFKLMLKKLFEKYPLTLTLIYIASFLFAILMDTDLMDEEWIQKLFMFGTIWGVGTFFAENVFEKGKKRIGLYVLTAIISYVFIHFTFINKYENTVIKWLVCYISTMCAISIYSIIKKSEKDFPEYILKVAINIAKSSFVYGILAIGVASILWVFDVLILDVTSKYIDNIEILIVGFFYSTKIIYSFINLDDDVNKFFKNLIKYVLMPLIITAFIIIYLYIIKIFALRDIPKNQIFRIATALFIVGGFIWTVMNYFKEEGLMYKISTKLPLIFSPFILLQIYTLGIRISKNGITPIRYAGIVFIIFEVLYILCYIFKNKKIQNLIIIADVLLIISVLVPIINAFDVSIYSQIKNLNIYSQKSELTDEDKEKISGAYYYLQYTEKGKKYIKDNLNKEQINTITNYKQAKGYYGYKNYKSLYLNNNNYDKLEIKGYNYISKIETSSYSRNQEQSLEKAFSNIEFKTKSNKIKTNIYPKIKEFIEKKEVLSENEMDNYFDNNNEIIINQNQKLIIYYLSINYDENDLVDNYNINAYLLEK
ncbi:MAG TPA: hypothetical protein DEP51_01250 [Clostridiales bacterium]|nr:hypothetical protein [Clostridiales bacterium]